MAKTGLVERSGQGVDKIFYQSISEAKPEPDYTASDDFQVELKLSAIVEDKVFALFISYVQRDRIENGQNRLSVQEVIALNKIRKGEPKDGVSKPVISVLLDQGLIEKVGQTNRQNYRLSRKYYSLINKEGEYTNADTVDEMHATMLIMKHLGEFGTARMGDFVSFLDRFLSRDQIKRLVYKMVEQGTLTQNKAQRGTSYWVSEQTVEKQQVLNKAMRIGLEEMRKRGELE